MQLHLFEPDLYAKPSGEVGQLPISGKQCQRHSPLAIFVENFDCSTPGFALTVVNLSKVEHLPLNNLTTPTTAILDDVQLAMLFAVFDPRMVPEEHYGQRFYSPLHQWKELWSALHKPWSSRSFIQAPCREFYPEKSFLALS
jgi:hypothetical protein